ncbi:amino acid adenylation domain-containing protein [Actinacidiphila yanglinensis]|uniref:Amino acid adenylation domain-containing protein n=1 Tax=Actinacidiphila yanglinensis TaxID=310779 RepID=A0A1H6D6E2_9ACTN|nr:non-ribosomal peptide synthetase/MFS transporter [Actinacidiphila yanglinensis]SEG80939.1 amino acid adenylation domain-containing protein [Actinacidiphila yanglinensis]
MLTPADARVAASPAQRRMWFLDQLTPGDPAYHMFLVDRLRGPLDAAALGAAVDAVVARHEILRTRFPAPDGQPCQEVLPPAPVPIDRVDLTGAPPETREEHAREAVAVRTNAPFDLAAAPPLRVALIRLGDEDHVLCLVLHHMVADGWSLYVWRRELAAHYAARLRGEPPELPELPLQYAEVAHATAATEHLAYWTEQLDGVPALDLPTDRPRPAAADSAAGVHAFRLDQQAAAGIKALARQCRATPFMVLFAVCHTLLNHLGGQPDFCLGSPVAARDRVELEPMIGPLAGILVLRPEPGGDPAFSELVRRVRKVALGAFTHGPAPLEHLVDALDLPRDLSRNPLYQAVFALHTTAGGYGDDVGLAGTVATPFPHGCHRAKVDLSLEMWPQPDGYHCELTYRTDLFDAGTAEHLARWFTRLLAAVVADPQARLSALWPSPASTPEVAAEPGAASVTVPDATVADLVRRQARRRPDAIAVECGDTRISYAGLVALAERVAAGLLAEGVGTGDVVAVRLSRSAQAVGALLGVMLAGAAYLPIDPDYPDARITYVREDSGARAELTDDWLRRLGGSRGSADAGDAGDAGDAAYLIYTSGSSGRPKGVVVPHRALSHLLAALGGLLDTGPRDVWLAATSLSFDISALELFLPLVNGGRVVVADGATVRDGGALARLVAARGVTHVQATPSGWRNLLDGGVEAAALTALAGGEALPLALATELRARVARLLNVYGPTETTIWSTAWEVPHDPVHVSLGRPLLDTRLTVVDGELLIGGAGLANGYHARPELTAERFVRDADGTRWYRTGDRVRRRPDGELEYLGRLDDQVKVRGHRVEPGEIEAALEALPSVRRAVVAVREERLVAYVVGSADGVLARLSTVLPGYLVPDTVRELDALPLTPNGKVDRRALPAPGRVRSRGGPPRTDAERRVAAVFAEVLDLEAVGADDDFFALGGHSLLATRVAARLGAIPVRTLFTHPTVSALASALGGHTDDAGGPRPRGDRPPPLSPAQERLWFLHRLDPDDASYTMYLVRRLLGPLDTTALTNACTGLVSRHEALRTRFPDDDGRPVAVVEPPSPVRVEHLVAAGTEEARQLVAERVNAALDLAGAPPVRFTLIRTGAQEHVLCVVLDHIVADGWSLTTLLAELSALYRGDLLPPLPVQHGDIALWQRERDNGAALAYWREQLADPPELDLPRDGGTGSGSGPGPRGEESGSGPRGGNSGPDLPGAFQTRQVPADLADALDRVSRDAGVTPFMTLLAAYQLLLARHTGQRDLLVGSATAGRDRVEAEPVIGYLSNTVVLRATLRAGDTFTDLLHRTRDTVLEAMAHQQLPFEELLTELGVRRDVGRTPLFRTMAILHSQDDTDQATFGDLRLEPFDSGYRQAKFDLLLEAWRRPEGLLLAFAHDTGRISDRSAAALADRFVTLLAGIAATPSAALAALPVLTAGDHTHLAALAGTGGPAPATTVPALIAASVHAHPDATALICGGTEISYAELDRRAGMLAAALRRGGVRRGSVVGVCLPRSVDAVVALLAVWRAGAAYLPLDPELPPARRAHLVADSAAALVVDERYRPADGPAPAVEVTPGDAAYVIYTSGSTGTPKGVVVEHGSLAARVVWMRDAYELTGADRVVQFASVSFDTHAEEIYPALAAGAAVVLLPGGGTRLPELLAARRDITVLDLPTAYFHRLADMADEVPWPDGLRLVVIGGEQVRAAAVAGWRAHFGGAVRLLNTYGPTETTIVATAGELHDDVHIGRPIAATTAWVLDEDGGLAPPGAPGELAVGGAGVARGYLGRPELTAGRFTADPWGPPGARLYRTGDRVRWRPDGRLEFLGRVDDQFKVRGFRVEPGEVEAALLTHPAVTAATVTTDGESLAAYVVAAGDPPGPAELRSHVAELLPAHLVPTAVVHLAELPLTVSGKVDRSRLPAPQPVRSGPGTPPRTDTERAIAAVWAELLDAEQLGVDDDFFDLGGHSLLAVRAATRTGRALGRPVAVMDLFQHPTVRWLAAFTAGPAVAERGLLHRLTPPRAVATSFVCVPYGGAGAIVYQPLADALPADCALWSVAIPGHDAGLAEERQPFAEVAARCTAEILATVRGPLVLYGHSGIGTALAVEIARLLEAAGRTVDAVHLGAAFPFGRPGGRRFARLPRLDALRGDRTYANWLTSMGVDLHDIGPEQARRIVRTMRLDTEAAEEYFTALFDDPGPRLRAPVVAVAGDRDPATEYYQERFREWHLLSDSAGVVVLDEAGHFFPRHRAEELAAVLTRVHPAVLARTRPAAAADGPAPSGEHWRLHATSRSATPVAPPGPRPSMRRFLAVAGGQLVSLTGSVLTQFALPLWIYRTTGSLAQFALFAVVGLVPGLLVAPLAGAVVDRSSRRAVMLWGDGAAGCVQLLLGVLLWTGHLAVWHLYPALALLSAALTFQRVAYTSAVPQLVPKRFLGHANGIVQLAGGSAQLAGPLAAAGLMAAIGLRGVLAIDVATYACAVLVTLAVRFPRTMAWRRREPVLTEIRAGFAYSWRHPGFRRMLVFFACLNVFLSPLFLMTQPLVLAFGTIGDLGVMSFVGGLGVVLGATVMVAWGGPRRRRMRAVLLCALALAVCAEATGVRPSLPVIGAGVFGMGLCLTLLNGIYNTIVQVKVPQRFHGRVLALNTLVAWSTLPIGFGLVAPYGGRLLEPLLRHGGALAPTVGRLIGTGPGRGIGFLYLLLGAAIVAVAAVALRSRLAGFDEEVPDAAPDDLVGLEALARSSDPPH